MSQKQFGPFVLERLIGRGGMGAVYRAHHETTGQTVAVKALLLPLEQERERFEAEIATLKLLRHENIVKLYGFGQEDGILYYAMEYIDGPSLSTLLKRGRRFTWEEVVYIGASVCKALKHAHDRGVVHRDVKPANILLLNDGRVKVSDYGIAQYFGNSRITSANQVVGTIEYMAPEQARAGALTPRADVYSLGALMYALLTGSPPYAARSLAELLRKFQEEKPEPIRTSRPETPKVVDAAIFDLLELQPEQRPGDARIIGRRLEGLLKTSPNCPSGNPFLDQRFCQDGRSDSENVSSSRVDLTSPSELGEGDYRREAEELENRMPDFPYRPIVDESGESLSFKSPFEKTTQRAPLEEETAGGFIPPLNGEARDDRDDFVLIGEETETSGDNETRAPFPFERFQTRVDERRDDAPEPVVEVASESAKIQDIDERGANRHEAASPRSAAVDVGAPSESNRRSADPVERKAKRDAPNPEAEIVAFEPQDDPARAAALDRGATTVFDETPKEIPAPKREPKRTTIAPQAAPPQEGLGVPFEALDAAADKVEATPVEQFKRSQFTPVDEKELGNLPREPKERRAIARVRFWCLVAALIATIAACLCASSNTRNGASFEKIDRTLSFEEARTFDAKLSRMRSQLERYAENAPKDSNDPSSLKTRYFLDKLEIDDLDRRLQNAGRDVLIGDKYRDKPNERAYLDALGQPTDSLEDRMERISAYIDLFGSNTVFYDPVANKLNEKRDALLRGDEEPKDAAENLWRKWEESWGDALTQIDRLTVLARRQQARLEYEKAFMQKTVGELLEDRLDAANDASIEPEHAEAIRRAAIVLFKGKSWASSILEEKLRPEAKNEASPAEENAAEEDAAEENAAEEDAANGAENE